MTKLFGTDGIRGLANRQLTPELAFRIGRIGSHLIVNEKNNAHIVIGRDTRLSGEMLESAMIAGMLSIGVNVTRLGVTSSPSIAYLTRHLKASAGVMISASHNPFPDNGIKFFGSDGFKLTDHMENKIEEAFTVEGDPLPRPTGKNIGKVMNDPELVEGYLEHLKSTIDTDLCGLNIVVDCANGAAYRLAPSLLRDLGADVTSIHVNPDGTNINVDSGSTNPYRLQKEVLKKRADLGLAFDGDADRLIAVDEKGNLIDGDQIMFICSQFFQERGILKGNQIVTTVMSNIGFFNAMRDLGISTERTKVGDRYVLEKMLEMDSNLGGEQSGHIIFLDYNTTGDGLLTALQLLSVVKEKGQTLSGLSKQMTKYPQILENVRIQNKNGWDKNEAILASIRQVEQLLGKDGRVLVRASGTEPLIRVMIEGPDEELLKIYSRQISSEIRRQFE